MPSIYQETKFIINKYHITANKSLGQNFLISEEAVEAIVGSANISKEDIVIEIGPGLGTLTKELLECAGKVICVELDTRMVNIITDRFALYTNIEIINQDILKIDLKELIKNEKESTNLKNVKVVANLPYYITTPIIMKLLEERLDIESITIMIQKEVAQRLLANPGDNLSGAITYGIHYYSEPEKIADVSHEDFIPAPEVDSQVIKLNIRKNPPVDVGDEEKMFKIIKLAFMQRRKTLINALTNGNFFNNKQEIEEMLQELNIDKKIRGEKLTLEQFAEITNYINKKVS